MRRNWLLSLAVVVALVGLIYGISAGALWDPYEVTVAELSRRIGLNLFGGRGLAIAGADNSLPIRADLGRGELPFSSAALGFRVFGLSAWAGRLPLLLWSLLGLGALHAAMRRLWDRRAALYASLVLATTPLYYLQARVLLGDAVTLAAFALAWSGLAVACLAEGASWRTRLGFLLLGVLGLYAGFWCRGPLVSVAVPALSVAGAGLLSRPRERFVRWTTLATAVTGALALALGLSGLALARQTFDYSVFVGTTLAPPSALPTFDVGLGNLLHAAYPWSAAAPLALVVIARQRAQTSAQGAVVNAAALALGSGLAASAWLASAFESPVLPAVCCLAVLIACGLRELEEHQLGSPLLGLVIAALAVVIGLDLRTNPDKVLTGFGLGKVTLPESLAPASALFWLCGAGALAASAVLCCYERAPPSGEVRPVFQRAEYANVLQVLQRTWRGNLVFALLLLEAALVGFLLLSAISERLVALPQLDGFGSFSRKLVAYAAIGLPLAPLGVLGAMVLRDAARVVFDGQLPRDLRRWLPTRAEALLLTFVALGALASLGFYPALARQVAPKQAFERYRELRRGNEALGVLGEQSFAARYQGAPDAQSFDAADAAFDWLSTAGARRWLLLRKDDLPELNANFRALHGRNLPILDARSSEVLLASSQLGPGERDESPFSQLVLAAPPAIQHPLQAVFGEQLELLGWSLSRADGTPAAELTPAEPYRFSIYYRVLAPLQSGSWQTFVHLDGLQRRFNADHAPLDGKYPLRLWRPNDVLVDATVLRLEPNFSPGPYKVYFGLFTGDKRFPVTEGPADEDRIVAGTLQVR